MNINNNNHQIYIPFKANSEGLAVGFQKFTDEVAFALEMKGNRTLTQTLSDTFSRAENEIVQELGVDKNITNEQFGSFYQFSKLIENGIKRGYQKEALIDAFRIDKDIAEDLRKPSFKDGIKTILQRLNIIDENGNFRFSSNAIQSDR